MATPIPLSDVVSVSITAEQSIQSQGGFAIPLIIDEEYVYGSTSRVLTVGSLAEMLAAGYAAYNKAYRLASLAFSQSPRPKQLKIGQWNLPGAETIDDAWAAIVATDPDFYLVCMTDRTEANINTLASSVLSASSPYFFYAETSDAAVLSGAVGNVAEDLLNIGNDRTRVVYRAATAQVLVMTVSATVTAGTFTGTLDGNALSVPYNVSHDQTMDDVATAIQALSGVATAVATAAGSLGASKDIITVTSADAFIQNKLVITANLTGGSFSQAITTAASTPLAATLCGYFAPHYPGVKTEAFARPVGVAADNFTTAQRATLLALNVGWYGQYGQISSMGGGSNYGRVASGTVYTDLKWGIDWLTLAIQSAVMARLQSGTPVPYTTPGIEEVKQAIRGALAEGVSRGFVQPSGDTADGDLGTIGYTVTAPALSAISDANKTARHLPDVSFQARAASAVQQVTISGTLSL